jgi:O-antigen ligase
VNLFPGKASSGNLQLPATNLTASHVGTGLVVASLAAATLFAAQWIPADPVSWETIRIVAIGVLACLSLYMVLAFSKARADVSRRSAFKVGLAIWWFLLVSDELFFRAGALESGFEGHFDPLAYAEAISWVFAFLVLMLISTGAPAYLSRIFSGPYKWLSLFALVCLLSSAYSPRPIYSFVWAFKLWLVVLLLYLCATCMRDLDDIRAFFQVTFWALLLLTVSPAIRTLAEPSATYWQGRLYAPGSHPVTLSENSAALLLVSLTLYSLRRQKWLIPFGIIAATVMIRSGGKAGILAGIVSAVLFFVFQKRFALSSGLLAGFLLLGVAVASTTPLSGYLQEYQKSDALGSLTGRTEVWTSAWPAIMQAPLWGHGYMAAKWVSLQVEGVFAGAGSLHNAFMDVVYNNGLIGLALFLAVLIVVSKNLRQVLKNAPGRDAYLLAVGTFALYLNTLLNGLFEGIFGSQAHSIFVLFLGLVVVSQALVKFTACSAPESKVLA